MELQKIADAKGNLRGEYYRKGLRKEVMGEKYTKDMRRGLYKPEELTSEFKVVQFQKF